MSANLTLARPYAKALFLFAIDSKLVDEWTLFLSHLKALFEDQELKDIAKNPFFSGSVLVDVVNSLLKSLPKGSNEFLKMLVEKKRTNLIADIFKLFEEYRNQYSKVFQVQATTAFPLSNESLSRLKKSLVGRLGGEVNIHNHIDTSMLGGIRIQYGDRMIDFSITEKLKQLSQTLFYSI